MRGIFEFKIGEVERGFKFGTYAVSVACEKENCTVDELFRRIGVGAKSKEQIRVNPMTLLSFFYGAAVHYAESKRKEIDFKVVDVSDWLDEIGAEQTQKILLEGVSVYLPKNFQPPQTEGAETPTATP
jgi:hypothetical protein